MVWTLAGAWVAANVMVWALFRWDKRSAERGARRVPERTLLLTVIAGAAGALCAMYGHARRHKVDKPGFVLRAWALAALHVFGVGVTIGVMGP